MPRVPCLARLNGGPWGLRRRVPDELRHIIGKREIWRSYRTDSFAEAKRRHAREMAAIEAMFTEARQRLVEQKGGMACLPPGASTLLALPTEADIRAAAEAWFYAAERKAAGSALTALSTAPGSHDEEGLPDPADVLDSLRADEAALAGPAGTEWAAKEAYEALTARGFAPLAADDLWHLALALFRRAAIEKAHRDIQRRSEARVETPRDPLFAHITAASPPPAAPQRTLSFGDLCDAYLSAPERAGISPKTRLKYNGMFRLLRDLLGADTAAAAITREDCRRAQVVLRTVPANAAQRYPGLSAKDAAEAAQRDGARPMHHKSVGNHLDLLAALYRWGIREKLVRLPDGNPAEGLNAATAKTVIAAPSGERRRPFTLEELRAIFAAPLFTGCKDDENGYAERGPNRPRRGRYWVPLLGLFVGLRLNEACQLRTEDVREDGGVPVIHVRASAEGQRLKTAAAERRIPVHP